MVFDRFYSRFVYTCISERSGLELLFGKFCQFLTELSACHMSYSPILAGYYPFTFFIVKCFKNFFAHFCIATDKRGYPHNIFLISPQKHMLWVLIRSASTRRF